jgi:hypothetical protein
MRKLSSSKKSKHENIIIILGAFSPAYCWRPSAVGAYDPARFAGYDLELSVVYW